MAKWKFGITEKGIKFSCQGQYRGEIYLPKFSKRTKVRIGDFLVRIINSFIEDKEDE